MTFFSVYVPIRVTPNLKKMVEEIQENYSDDFDDCSDVFRTAVIQLHRKLLPKSRTKGEITGFKDFKPE